MAVERWFERVGTDLASAQREAIATMLSSHALAGRVGIVVVAHWHEAVAALHADDRDSGWWDFEEEERERLWEVASMAHTEDQLLVAVEQAIAAREHAIDLAVKAVVARHAIADPEWGRAARAAALMAVHQQTLARLASAPPTQLFALKYQLFADGRWPLGVQSGRFLIY